MKTVKRLFCRGLCLLLCLGMGLGSLGAAADSAPTEENASSGTARAFLLMEQSTGQVLAEENADEHLAPASLTKLMVLLLIMEEMDAGCLGLEDTLTCSAYAKTMGGSEIWLEEGESMTVDDLLKALIIASANDAAVVFAEAISGSEEAFVQKMNQRAAELGLANTHFVNCTGFDEEGHYTSARDVALVARALMRYAEQITPYSTTWMDSLRGGETQLVNTNRLIRTYPGATGLKTGTTDAAGYCLCATATRDGMGLISVVMGCETGQERFAQSQSLLDQGFSQYTLYTPESPGALSLSVRGGAQEQVEVQLASPTPQVLPRQQLADCRLELDLADTVDAPVQAGQQLGRLLLLSSQGQELASWPLTAVQEVPRLTFLRAFALLGQQLLSF